MNRIAMMITLALAALALAGCGGGSGAPAPADRLDPALDANELITPVAPSEIYGDHSTTVVPNQINVLTGATPAELTDQLAKFGMTGIGKTGGWATLELPAGTDLDWAIKTLKKEYNIAKAEKVNVLHTARFEYDEPELQKNTSFFPFDPMFGGRHQNMYFNGTDWLIGPVYFGQQPAMDSMNFQAAWDVARNPGISGQEVRVVVIGAGFWDFSVFNWRGVDEASRFDADRSGAIAGDGTVTVGFDAAAWEVYDNGVPEDANEPYDMTASVMLGVMADDLGDPFFQTGWFANYFDLNQDTIVDLDEFWMEGAAGASPFADYVLLKTGQADVDTWSFNDNQIAAAIEYAAGDGADTNGGLWPNGGCDADIILLSMYANGAVGANVSAAIQTARDNNCLVIAPAGDVIDSLDGDPPAFLEMPVDIGVDSVTPASDPNCIAACATGTNRPGALPDITMDTVDYENLGLGWDGRFAAPFDFSMTEIPASYSNTGGDIAAVGYGMGWGVSPVFINGDPSVRSNGYNFANNVNRFGSHYSAAYVASAAAIVHQALNMANGMEPTDDEVWQAITDTWNYAPMTGLAPGGGMLDAGKAAYHAMEGATLYQPSMYFTGLTISQPPAELEPGVGIAFSGVVRGTTFEAAPTVDRGVAPFIVTVDWDNGEPEVIVDPWVNGDPITLDGGWDTLGQKGVNITVEDSDGQTRNWAMWVNVVNPISAGVTIADSLGLVYTPENLSTAVNYRFNSNLTNVYTGLIDGNPNVVTYSWDFNDGTPLATSENPAHNFATPGTFNVTLTVTQSLLPDRVFTVEVTVT